MSEMARNRTAACTLLALIALIMMMLVPQGGAFAREGSLAAGEMSVESSNGGSAQSKAHADGWHLVDGAWQYWKNNVQQANRWITTSEGPAIKGAEQGEHRYWIAADGNLAVNRLIDTATENDAAAKFCAYATKYGYVATGKTFVGNKMYLAHSNGKLETGDEKGILDTGNYDNGTKHRYIIDKTEHAALVGQLVKVPGWGYAYAIPKKGYIAQGMVRIDANHVLLAREDGRLCNKPGWLTTSTFTDGVSQRYYLEPTDKDSSVLGARTGLVKVKGWGYAYGFSGKGYIARGVTQIDANHVLLARKDGRLYRKPGFVYSSSFSNGTKERYYLDATQADPSVCGARTDVFAYNGMLYHPDSLGRLTRNKYQQVGRDWYNADNYGALHWNAVITRMYQSAQGYSSPSQYLLMVDTDDTKMIVFEGWQGNWNVKFIWDCSTGAPETPTVLGVFQVGLKGYSFGEDHGYSCYYWTQFYGDYLFHTRIYWANTHDLRDVSMNTRVSQGCVRLYDDDAYWIWTNVPSGTTVVTME